MHQHDMMHLSDLIKRDVFLIYLKYKLYRGAEYFAIFLPAIKLKIAIPSSYENELIAAIVAAANTG